MSTKMTVMHHFGHFSRLTRKVTHQFVTTHTDAPLSIAEVSEPCQKTKLLQSIATVTHQVRFFILRPFLESPLISYDI